jgi:hypothetical protein
MIIMIRRINWGDNVHIPILLGVGTTEDCPVKKESIGGDILCQMVEKTLN